MADALYTVAGNLKKFVTAGETSEQHLVIFFWSIDKGQVARLGWTVQPTRIPMMITDAANSFKWQPCMLRTKKGIDAAHTLFQVN